MAVGDRLALTLRITNGDKTHRELIQQVTYLVSLTRLVAHEAEPRVKPHVLLQVLSKGKIISAERVDVRDRLMTTVGLTVTSAMLPSFRFVAFYTIPWTEQEEVVSDSVWIDVADSCVGGVRAQLAKVHVLLKRDSVVFVISSRS